MPRVLFHNIQCFADNLVYFGIQDYERGSTYLTTYITKYQILKISYILKGMSGDLGEKITETMVVM